MTARWITADVFDGLATLETGSVDLVVTSPPFLALRSYLPADHELKGKEIGSEATPAEFIDTMLQVTAELRRVLASHGSICIELGDTYAGSGESGWLIPPGGYSGSHYAVFPEELVVPCVKAMCPQRVCRICGEPSRRIVETSYIDKNGHSSDGGRADYGRGGLGPNIGENRLSAQPSTLGWTDCGHDSWRPGLVLDPFAGSGTTLAVATGHGHDAIGIDIDSRNAELARDRVGPFLFDEVDA